MAIRMSGQKRQERVEVQQIHLIQQEQHSQADQDPGPDGSIGTPRLFDRLSAHHGRGSGYRSDIGRHATGRLNPRPDEKKLLNPNGSGAGKPISRARAVL